jgi:LmbE family N-acetylglucosaminyl deacetylase
LQSKLSSPEQQPAWDLLIKRRGGKQMGMRILAVGAHPDDLEILCAGTLAKYSARGDQVFMAISTNGDVGSPRLPKEEIARIREQEARASAAVIGAELHWLGYPDEFLSDDEPTRLRYIDLVRQIRPDVVITHDPVCDYHPDHLTTGRLLWNIRVMTTVPNIRTQHPPCEKIPALYFMDTIAGINFVPEEYVDITPAIEKKSKMLAAHASQADWLKDQYNMSYIEFMEICSRFRGLQAGVRFAECFRRSVTFPACFEKLLP